MRSLRMSEYLKHEDFVDQAPEHTGNVRINHTTSSCSGGRPSMVVNRKPDGAISAYCFRCGRSGYKSDDSINPYKHREHTITKDPLVLPDDLVNIHDESVPVDAVMWLHGSGLYDLPDLPSGWLRSYSPMANRVYLGKHGANTSWIARSLDKNSPNKYIENLPNKHEHCMVIPMIRNNNPRPVFIVEDLLSALVLAEQGHVACCLFGTEFTSKQLKKIQECKDVTSAIVWLDNDNTKVKLRQVEIKHTMQDAGYDTFIMKTLEDPKAYHDKKPIVAALAKQHTQEKKR